LKKGKYGTCTWAQWKTIMQDLITLVRKSGAKNIFIAAGFNRAYDLTPVINNPINADKIAYVRHPYPQKEKSLGNRNGKQTSVMSQLNTQ